MFGISLRRVSSDKVLQVVAVSIWNVTGVNLFLVADMGRVTKYFFFAWSVWRLCTCLVSRE